MQGVGGEIEEWRGGLGMWSNNKKRIRNSKEEKDRSSFLSEGREGRGTAPIAQGGIEEH